MVPKAGDKVRAENDIDEIDTFPGMSPRTELALLRAVNFGLVASIAVLSIIAVRFFSYEYCHGSSHNARGWYCETAYQNEDGYRALR